MTLLGFDTTSGEPVHLTAEARARGVYVIGATGTGKTTLLQSIAYQDMLAGDGVCVLDPHGDMIDWLLERVPERRIDDVILFNPADIEHPLGMNLLECNRDDRTQIRWVVSTIFVTLKRLFATSWGPRLEHVLNHTLWTAMTIKDSTFLEVLLLLTDRKYQNDHTNKLTETLLVNFWDDVNAMGSKERLEFVSSTVNKLTPFLLDAGIRNIIGQSHSSFNLRKIMDKRKIFLVNLAKGQLGENNSSLLGSVLINAILMAALSRRDMGVEERKLAPFHVIVDEYQNFANDSFAVLQSEARKYAVDLVVAHQFRDQLDDQSRGAALNVGSFISFRVTGIDGPELAMQFDNTPPKAEPIWQPHFKKLEGELHNFWQPGKVYVQMPGTPRPYSDTMMQTANDLSNLIPFRARAKLIVKDANRQRLCLVEHTFDTPNPYQKGEITDMDYEELMLHCYGIPNPEIKRYITQKSQDLATPLKQIEHEIRERTQGRADMDIPPAYREILE